MPRSHPGALPVTRRVLRALVSLNLLAGALILALLIASLVAEGPVMEALGVRPAPGSPRLIWGMRLIMASGIAAVPIAHLVLTRLLRIVETVTRGDPFVAANAARLESIAWAVLGLEVLHLGVGLVAALSSSRDAPLDLDWNFSVTRGLAVLLLFVLARVFEEGTRMREELEGTV
jgi:Protein of unknown function (DUF2975)